MHWIYLIHEFHNLSWITEINDLFHDILIYWDAPVIFLSTKPVPVTKLWTSLLCYFQFLFSCTSYFWSAPPSFPWLLITLRCFCFINPIILYSVLCSVPLLVICYSYVCVCATPALFALGFIIKSLLWISLLRCTSLEHQHVTVPAML